MASLYKQGNVYRISYYDKVIGKSKTRPTHTSDLKKAKLALRKFEAELELGLIQPKVYSNSRVMNLSEGLEIYLSQKQLVKRSKATYRSAVKSLILSNGDKPIYRYDNTDYTGLIQSLKEKSKTTISTYTRHLYYLFKFFIEHGYIKNNPIKITKPEEKKVRIIPFWELGRILNKLKGEEYEIIKLIYLAALRRSEVSDIDSANFDYTNRIFYVNNIKGKRTDGIPIPKDLYKFALRFKGKGKIFKKGYDGIRFFWEKLETGYTLHDIRRTRLSFLANKGVEPLYLKQFARHKNINTTLKYYVNLEVDKARNGIDSKL